ncbi:hypothetical protein KP509_06G003700 [Ceratopteris richardii]|nr:hypothetical protein KP509_06G003700 [Ceratopteris richardii]
MDIQVVPLRKSNRIYSSPTPEVREKIRQSLKSLDARTGSVTRRMRRIHNDPVLNAKRIAAIKKAKGTEAARKHVSEKLRQFFKEPGNRILRSLSLKGADFHCSHCGEKGHRRNYCPKRSRPVSTRSYRTPRCYHCSVCGESGHSRINCPRVLPGVDKYNESRGKLIYRCGICKEIGHNARSCQRKFQENTEELSD